MKSKYEEKDFTKIVLESLSYSEVCLKLNLIAIGGNLSTVKKYINKYKIDISHFTGSAWNVGKRYKKFGKVIPLEDILIEKSTYTNNRELKKKLFKAGLKENKCEVCFLTEWNNNPITLELHHINGENLDNRLENLQIICPNCHSQTDNFCAKNKTSIKNLIFRKENDINTKQEYRQKKELKICSCGNSIKDNRSNNCRECYKKTITKKQVKLCSCGKEIKKSAKNCRDCYNLSLRKVERPSIDILMQEVKEQNYTAVGRKYGVSDNAIRKWIKSST